MSKHSRKRKNKGLKILGIILIMVLINFIFVAVYGWWYLNNKLGEINYQEIPEEKIEINEGIDLEQKGYRTVAIFGVDSRADTYSDTRSDCIIIVAINQDTKEIKLISVYRDTYLNINGYGLDKVTHAFAYGGPELSINTLNTNLDLDINEYVALNFGAVVDVINEFGGIDIEITSDELKYINSYIREIDKVEKTSTRNVEYAGKQTLNGVQALAYSRIRYTAGGDYKRTERMRDVIIATFEKAKQLGVSKLDYMLDKLLPEVSTNIKAEEIKAFIPDFLKYKINTSIGWPYEVRGITLNRWYGVPVTLESCVKKLHQEVFGETEYEPSNKVKEISNSIIKKTGYR